MGLLLPGTVTVRAELDTGGGSIVDVLDPRSMVEQTGISGLEPVAEEAAARLSRVRRALAGAPAGRP